MLLLFIEFVLFLNFSVNKIGLLARSKLDKFLNISFIDFTPSVILKLVSFFLLQVSQILHFLQNVLKLHSRHLIKSLFKLKLLQLSLHANFKFVSNV